MKPREMDEATEATIMRMARDGVSFLEIGNRVAWRPLVVSAVWHAHATPEEQAARVKLVDEKRRKHLSAKLARKAMRVFPARRMICEFPADVQFHDDPAAAAADVGRAPMRPATHTHGASSAAMAVG